MAVSSSGGGFKTLRKKLEDLSKLTGKTGWPSDATYDDGTKVADVAIYQEFGTAKIPPRPFMRLSISENKNKWLQSLNESTKTCLQGALSPNDVFEKAALMAAKDIAQSFKTLTPPAVTPKSTNNQSAQTRLLEEGTLINTITGKVEQK